MKISGFTITTNPIAGQYPIKECIASWLPIVDEMVIVDGGSTDGFLEYIKELNNPKIILYNEADTKWEDDWTYWRMGYNWGKGFDICDERGADFIIKFDADYIIKSEYNLRKDFDAATTNEVLTVSFHRKNFQIVDRYFEKKRKTIAVNMTLARKMKLNVKWGYDLEHWGMCDEAIIYEFDKDNLKQGRLLNRESKIFVIDVPVFNYGYCFRDKKVSRELIYRNMRAFYRQQIGKEIDEERIWQGHLKGCRSAFTKPQILVPLESHPLEIQDTIKNLNPDKQGYDFWGEQKKAIYYE